MDKSTDICFRNLSLKMLVEMNDRAQHLVKLMKQGIVDFMYKKVSTGKKRKARGTLKRSLIPPKFQRKRGRPKKRPDYLVIYYDIDRKDIRSFKDELLDKMMSKPYDPEEDITKDDNENEQKNGKQNNKNSSNKLG